MQTVRDMGEAVFASFANALNLILTFIPRFIGFLVILIIGAIVASLVKRGVAYLLRKVGFERVADRVERRMRIQMDSTNILSRIAYWFVFLIFLVSAIDALGLPAVSNLLNTVIGYLPNVFVAILVLLLGTLVAILVADLVRGATAARNIGEPNLLANIAFYAIMGFAVLIALEQLQIAPALINILFTATIGAVALAFALAFGLGGRDVASRWLSRTEKVMGSGPQTPKSIPTYKASVSESQPTMKEQSPYPYPS